jgi:hypothetical protein
MPRVSLRLVNKANCPDFQWDFHDIAIVVI